MSSVAECRGEEKKKKKKKNRCRVIKIPLVGENETREGDATFRKGAKRKRANERDVCAKNFRDSSDLKNAHA